MMYDSLSVFLFHVRACVRKGCMILLIYLPHIIEAILVTPNSNLNGHIYKEMVLRDDFFGINFVILKFS